jgi:hypothetical protein
MDTSTERLQELRDMPVKVKRPPKGERPRKKTQHLHTFRRTNQTTNVKEVRRRLAYYLHPDLAEAYIKAVSDSGKLRREFLIACIKRYFAYPRHKKEAMDVGLPKKELKFFYDEVPLSVHERVQDHCMDRRWNKRIPMYKVINTAITEMLIHLQESNESTNQPD